MLKYSYSFLQKQTVNWCRGHTESSWVDPGCLSLLSVSHLSQALCTGLCPTALSLPSLTPQNLLFHETLYLACDSSPTVSSAIFSGCTYNLLNVLHHFPWDRDLIWSDKVASQFITQWTVVVCRVFIQFWCNASTNEKQNTLSSQGKLWWDFWMMLT